PRCSRLWDSTWTQGRIHGHGHPTRDALGWTIPPLWPMKLVALPGVALALGSKVNCRLRSACSTTLTFPAMRFFQALLCASRSARNQINSRPNLGTDLPKARRSGIRFAALKTAGKPFDRTRDCYHDP